MISRKPTSRTDGITTKQRILNTSVKLFAQYGFADTSNKLIATQAEVDLASINYHFGNRNGLYQAILMEAHSKLLKLEILQGIESKQISDENKLKQIIDTFCHSNIQSDASYGQVLAREILVPSSNLIVLFNEEVQPKIQIIKKVLANIAGIPFNSPILAPCLLNVAAPCLMLLLSNSNLPGPFQQIQKMDKNTLTEHMYTFCLAGLRSIGEHYREHQCT